MVDTQNNNKDEDYASQDEKDWITDRMIDILVSAEYEDCDTKLDPYSLDTPSQKLFDESKHFVKGIKEPESCRSLIECEIYREINGRFDISGVLITNNKYVQVIMPGLQGKYYIELSKLKRLLSECTIDTDTRPCLGGEVILAIMEIDRLRLLNNLIVRRQN